jgi:hypothetical protein
MSGRLFLIGVAFFLFGCSHGKTVNFPPPGDPTEDAEVYVFRNKSLLGLGFGLEVMLDGKGIAFLRAGEYISFRVPPGFHSVGAKGAVFSGFLRGGKTYYFLISLAESQFGFEIEPIDDEEAVHWVSRSRKVE